jgi:hypothetical protein
LENRASYNRVRKKERRKGTKIKRKMRPLLEN